MRCDIIVPVWNQLEVTKECIDSILKHTDYPYRLIIIDNGSEPQTRDYLNSLKSDKGIDICLIRNEKNLGFIKAVNQGINTSDSPYLCIINNDTVATGGWLREMVDVMEAHPEIGLLNPSSNTSGQFPGKGQSIDDYASTLKCFKGEIQELYNCRGFCMLLRRQVPEKLGPLNETYHLGYFDDADYSKRAQCEGFRAARAKAAYVYHKENISFKRLSGNDTLFRKNEDIFFKKWGRPVRVGYFLDHALAELEKRRIDDIAVNVARSGHQILIFLKKGLDWPIRLDHFDIRRSDVNPILFGASSIFKILKRKKKKKIDILLTDDRLFGVFLKMTRSLHGSDVVIKPDRESLLLLLREKSKCS